MTKEALIECMDRIRPHIHRTPVLSSRQLDELTGASIFLKCENFQRMGAFKMRGATNAIMNLSSEQKSKGVVTHSSGNYAQAVSLAASIFDVDAHIVMPRDAPAVKKSAVKGYGGRIVECEPTIRAREEGAAEIQNSIGASLLHPSDQMDVILGQGTAAMELIEDHPDLDFICTPIGGGGLVAGSALAAHYFAPGCRVIGAEPSEVDDAFRSLKSGRIESNETTNTIADGLKSYLGEVNFPIIQEHVERIILVSEEEIVTWMKFVWERMKIIIEASSAVAVAAVMKEKDQFAGRKVGIIISGGNADLSNLPF